MSIAVVTGATSGIGKELARGLVQHGMQVAIVGRDPDRTQAAASEVGASDSFLADLSVMDDVRRVASELRERYERIDVLANNAGIHAYEPRTSADGFDLMVATNHLGPFLLTNLLMDRLSSRVVVTASEAHRRALTLDIERLGEPGWYRGGDSFRAYGATKLMNVLFTQELAQRLPAGVTANCFCPGLVDTELARESSSLIKLSRFFVHTPIVRTPQRGARMGLQLATERGLAGVSGHFFSSTRGMGFLPDAPARKNRDLQQRLWTRTSELVGL